MQILIAPVWHVARRTPHHLSLLIAAGGGLIALTGTAAAIECRGEFQIIQGQELATPYCQDNYLAKIAREYGSRISAREIRNNPNAKGEVCRFMGHDTRISHICQPYRNDVGRSSR